MHTFRFIRTTRLHRLLLHILIICSILSLSSCSFLFPNKLLQTPKDFSYTELQEASIDYKILPGDKFELFIYSNKGDKLINPVLVTSDFISDNKTSESLIYEIDNSGKIILPIVGEIQLAGYTETEAVKYLQTLYAAYYIEPYIHLQVLNKRVTVYRGNANAMVLPLENSNMTISEAIAASGGIPPTGKAKEIKIARQMNDSLQISIIDLTTMEGMQLANMKVQPNDIIYIEPTINTDFIKEIAPIIATVSNLVILYIYLATYNQN